MLRLARLFTSRPLCMLPALGFCMVPRALADGLKLERPPAGIAPTWLCAIDCRRLAVCCWNDAGRDMLLCAVPTKRCEAVLCIVAGAAGRPLADRLAREGTTGRLPAIMRAPRICSLLAPMALTGPEPK
jgi:hypothetical protein